MSDLIDRRDAIEKFAMTAPQMSTIHIYEAVDILDSLQTVQLEPQWVPVSERMPEDYVDVLVWFEYFRYGNYNRMYATHGIGNYSKEYNSWAINHETGWKDLHVIAWMPLPDPYKEMLNEDR